MHRWGERQQREQRLNIAGKDDAVPTCLGRILRYTPTPNSSRLQRTAERATPA